MLKINAAACARGIALLVFSVGLGAACIERDEWEDERASWSVHPTPLLEISDDDPTGDVVLGEAVHVTRLPDGGVLVADRGLHALRFFAPDGRFLRALGRKGTGPGEFEYIAGAYRCGDSLFVEEIAARRMTVHGLDGTLARTQLTAEFAGGTDPYHSACNADGLFVHHGWYKFDAGKSGRHREPVAVWLASSVGQRRAALPNVDGPEYVAYGYGAGAALLGRTPQLAMGRRHVYVGSADSAVIQVYTLDGTPAGARALPDANVRVTDADLELAKRRDSMGQSARHQAQTRDEWALDTPPTTLPAYDAMIVDSDDHLWVRRHPVASDARTPWIVFDSDGTHVATVELSAVLTVHEIGRDYIAGIVLDPETGSHSVRVLALSRSSSP